VDRIDTDYYRITVNDNGTLNIYDKRLKRLFPEVLYLEDAGMTGMNTIFPRCRRRWPIDSREVKATWSLRQNRHFAWADIRYRLPVPQDLESRRAKRRDSAVDVALRLTIPVSEPIIDLRIELNNRAKDHRLRLHVPTGIEADHSTADQPFGVIERPSSMRRSKSGRRRDGPNGRIPFTRC